MLSHEEFSNEAHRVSHEAAEETNSFVQLGYRTSCFHRWGAYQEERWTREKESSDGTYYPWSKDGVMQFNPDLDYEGLAYLIGRNVVDVKMSEETLEFRTDAGDVLTYVVDGECCSRSYFYDMHGRKNLIENGPVVSIGTVKLAEPDVSSEADGEYVSNYVVQAYGYQIVTEHPQWGEQTTVFSFRNDSTGDYGGTMFFAGITQVEPCDD